MLPKSFLPSLALAGFLFGVYSAVHGNQPQAVAQPVSEPAQAPFPHFIAGSGIVEARTRNLEIGTPLPGIVKTLTVKVGDRIEAGAVLFVLDDREPQAELAIRRADLVRAQAGVAEAAASVTDAKTLLNLAEAVTDRRAISTEELDRRRNALLIAKARLDSAKAQVTQAEAQLDAVKTFMDRLVVRAPMAGEVLQINLRPGEFAQAGVNSTPLLVMGNLDHPHVRVDIDENDAWRFRPGGKAVAFLRGNRRFSAPLTLAYVEPYVVPKRSLTGDSTERVDTRVLQALYSFDRGQLPAYVGQQLDVFIEAPDASAAPTPPGAQP
ncbi:HlyD family secretion protein [Methylomagnum ishizawai]|uniref:HlyD family secretion protein n=1 Tax=Methylomagnum ishizawai TaxID=1760988 RepID=A0A1Y6D3C3_9GAMM|nr:HlyD family efflux transporter periplasmic adaptor subunit [Methylomagnum ishizawai]SMF97101.1 HlyD family secretion protein [Methylomagnum ishizawai]